MYGWATRRMGFGWLFENDRAWVDRTDGDGVLSGDVPVDVVHGVAPATPGGVVAGVLGLVLEGAGGGFGQEVGVSEGDLLDGDEAVARGVSSQQTQAGEPGVRGIEEAAYSWERGTCEVGAAGDESEAGESFAYLLDPVFDEILHVVAGAVVDDDVVED